MPGTSRRTFLTGAGGVAAAVALPGAADASTPAVTAPKVLTTGYVIKCYYLNYIIIFIVLLIQEILQ